MNSVMMSTITNLQEVSMSFPNERRKDERKGQDEDAVVENQKQMMTIKVIVILAMKTLNL